MQIIKNWSLPIAMIMGGVFYTYTSRFSFLTPILIFLMLLFTFSRLSPKEITFHKLYIYLFLIQIAGALALYALLSHFNLTLAESGFICILAPTATAASVITGMLGGSIAFLTGYLIFCNIGISILAPILFSFIGTNRELPFLESVITIAAEVVPMLLLPLLLAWFMQYFTPGLHRQMLRFNQLPFYLWVVALTITMGKTVDFIIRQGESRYHIEIAIGILSLLICAFQFITGKKLGKKYIGDSISPGQALGQKNTILAIWMAHTYLNPIASLGPATYIIWQNIVNSVQLWLYNKNKKS